MTLTSPKSIGFWAGFFLFLLICTIPGSESLSKEQEDRILKLWESRVDNPPSLLEIIKEYQGAQ